MNYGITFSQMLAAQESDLNNWDIANEAYDDSDYILQELVEFNEWMRDNIKYGLRINGRWDPRRNTTAADWDKYLITQSPNELEQSRVGICWDFVAYAAQLFKRNYPHIPVRGFYIELFDGKEFPTHTILTFDLNHKTYYFEVSFWEYAGIYQGNLSDILNAVLEHMVVHKAPNAPASSTLNSWGYGIWEYNPLDPTLYGVGCEEFMKSVMEKGKKIQHRFRPGCDITEVYQELDPAQEVLTLNSDEERSRNSAEEKADPKKPENMTADTVQELDQQLENQFKKISEVIERIHGQTLKLLNNTWDGNATFIGEYSDTANSYKQVPELTVINWTYGHKAENYLHGKVVTLRAQMTTNVNYLNNIKGLPEDALITKSGKALDQAVCAALGAPSSIENPNEFMGHLRTQFRGRKSEKTYRGEMANVFMQEIRAFDKTKTIYQQDINAAERMAKSAHGIVRNHIRNGSESEEDKRSALRYLKNVYRIITLYVNIITFTYRLHVEYILNRRALVTRLFEK